MKTPNIYSSDAEADIYRNAYKNAFDYMCDKTFDYDSSVALMTIFGSKISYRDLKKNIYQYGNRLREFGLKKADRISLVLPNIPELVYYKYAAWSLGIVVNLIDPRFNPNGIKESIDRCKSRMVITVLDAYMPKIAPIVDDLSVEKIIVVNPTDSIGWDRAFLPKNLLAKSLYYMRALRFKLTCKEYRVRLVEFNTHFMSNSKCDSYESEYERGMDAAVVFTSGTTGTSKGAVLTHDSYNIKVNQIKYALPKLNPNDTFLAAIPFFSAYGSFAGMHANLSSGEKLVLIPKFKPNEFGDLVCKYRANTFIGVPKYIEDLKNDYQKIKKKYNLLDLSFIINPVTGGDVISAEVVAETDTMLKNEYSDAKVIVGYGSSETGGPIMTTVPYEEYYDPASTGVLFPGVKYMFINQETGECSDNFSEGEICISDPAMMDRYLDDETSTEEITVYDCEGNKYYKMGDLFSVNDKGMFYFKGRTKRVMMRPDGHTVHAAPIENVLSTHEAVAHVCVVGLSSPRITSGKIPTAFIVLNNGFTGSQELVNKLDAMQLSSLSERNRALAFTFTSELPYTLMTKVDYRRLETRELEKMEVYMVDRTFC